MRAWWQYNSWPSDVLVPDLIEEVANTVEPGFLLIHPASTIHHGASGMWVRSIIISFAKVYSSQRRLDSRSIGLNFHC
jgi:hypothetical protein